MTDRFIFEGERAAADLELRRTPTAPPTTAGWHYGYMPAAAVHDIIPWLVLGPADDLGVPHPLHYDDIILSLDKFVWFGPVPTCVEAK